MRECLKTVYYGKMHFRIKGCFSKEYNFLKQNFLMTKNATLQEFQIFYFVLCSLTIWILSQFRHSGITEFARSSFVLSTHSELILGTLSQA